MDTPELRHGDGPWRNEFKEAKQDWNKKRLNSIKIPNFGKKSLRGRKSSPPALTVAPDFLRVFRQRPVQSICDNSKELEFLECPICMDTLVQASILGCGHMFCYRHIMEWKSKNSWCPVCQRYGSGEPTRVYAVDALIESFWTQLSSHVQELILEARKIRMIKWESEKNEIMPKIWHEIEMIRLYFGTKGIWRGLTFPLIRWWKSTSLDFVYFLRGLMKPLGLLMAGCLLCGETCGYFPYAIFDFFAYLIHCIWMYPGWSDMIPLTCAN